MRSLPFKINQPIIHQIVSDNSELNSNLYFFLEFFFSFFSSNQISQSHIETKNIFIEFIFFKLYGRAFFENKNGWFQLRFRRQALYSPYSGEIPIRNSGHQYKVRYRLYYIVYISSFEYFCSPLKGESEGYTVISKENSFPISNYPLEQTEFFYAQKQARDKLPGEKNKEFDYSKFRFRNGNT